MVVVAGPPGSGKTSCFPVTAFGTDSFNIDDRCAQLLGSYRAIPGWVRRSVANQCERFVHEHIRDRRSFAVETTFRTTASIDQATMAQSHGFDTELIFIATSSVTENISRVLQRAQGGGHGASERDIRTIYEASIANLARAFDAFDQIDVYDSTKRWTAPVLVLTARSREVVRHGQQPQWLPDL